MTLRSTSLAVELSKLVVEALVKIGLTEQDVLSGAFHCTDFPWQSPPLIVEATLFNVPLSDYLDRPTYVNVDHLVNMFSDALTDMRNKPGAVLTMDGYRNVGPVIPHVRSNERPLHFSMPDGFPDAVSDYAGATLAMECAHLLHTNTRVSEFVSDDDNYYAVMPSGLEIGIKEGLPTVGADQWDMPISGMVQELLRTPRGAVWEGCDFNVISKVRDIFTYRKEDIPEFEALDWALQTLRILNGESFLLRGVQRIKRVAYERRERMVALQEAVKVSRMMAITDRQRIEALKRLLVPDLMKSSQFSKQLFNFYAVPPPILAPKVLARIQQAVESLLEIEEMLYSQRRSK